MTNRAHAPRSLALGLLCIAALGAAACGDKLLGVAGSIQVTPLQLDFGATNVGTPQSITVQVSNMGSAALTIAAIQVSSDPNGELSLSGLLTSDCSGNPRSGSTVLSPGECAQFVSIWTPNAAHAAQGSVEIDSDDAQNPAITLPVSGTATIATCTPACTSTQACCDNTCVDTQSDPTHCGGCNACASGQTCNSGVCTTPTTNNGCDNLTAPCPGMELCCNHACVDVSSSGGMCPCTNNGTVSDFADGTIIIPMDVCWQRGEDETTTPSYCTDNAKTTSDDAPLKAYGLVFFLIRHQVTVYVAIDPTKAAIDGLDMALVSLDSAAARAQATTGDRPSGAARRSYAEHVAIPRRSLPHRCLAAR